MNGLYTFTKKKLISFGELFQSVGFNFIIAAIAEVILMISCTLYSRENILLPSHNVSWALQSKLHWNYSNVYKKKLLLHPTYVWWLRYNIVYLIPLKYQAQNKPISWPEQHITLKETETSHSLRLKLLASKPGLCFHVPPTTLEYFWWGRQTRLEVPPAFVGNIDGTFQNESPSLITN